MAGHILSIHDSICRILYHFTRVHTCAAPFGVGVVVVVVVGVGEAFQVFNIFLFVCFCFVFVQRYLSRYAFFEVLSMVMMMTITTMFTCLWLW